MRTAAGTSDAAAQLRFATGYEGVRTAVRMPCPRVLDRWADELAAEGGDTPLLGARPRGTVLAPRYPALQWNGARHPGDPLFVAALLTAGVDRVSVEIGRALLGGDVVVATVGDAMADGPAIVDVRTLGCATVVALLDRPAGEPADEQWLGAVLDVAVSLMVLAAPGGPVDERTSLRLAGHPTAAGWLAVRAVAAGLVGMSAAVPATLTAVTGRPLVGGAA